MIRTITHEFQVGLERRHYVTTDWNAPRKQYKVLYSKLPCTCGWRWSQDGKSIERTTHPSCQVHMKGQP